MDVKEMLVQAHDDERRARQMLGLVIVATVAIMLGVIIGITIYCFI